MRGGGPHIGLLQQGFCQAAAINPTLRWDQRQPNIWLAVSQATPPPWAAAGCLGFFGFLRCGEFLVPDGVTFDPMLHLFIADVSLSKTASQETLLLNIIVLKTDQFRQGSTVALGSAGSDLSCSSLA